MTQYNEYGSIPQQVQDFVSSRVKVLDEYILIQTDEREYTALIRDMVTGEVIRYTFTQSLTNSGTYTVDQSQGVWEFNLSNEFYCYSNVGLGSALDLPVYDGIQAHGSAVLVVVLMFLVVFRSTLFPFRFRK